jgi:hypothetical protein
MPRVGCDTYESRPRSPGCPHEDSHLRQNGGRLVSRLREDRTREREPLQLRRGAIDPTAGGPVGLPNDDITTNNRIRLVCFRSIRLPGCVINPVDSVSSQTDVRSVLREMADRLRAQPLMNFGVGSDSG